jgi:RimJ/RimL family protein N-acetyltransferase
VTRLGPRPTDRLRFSPLTTATDDLDLLVDLTTDPEVMRFINGGRPIDRNEMARVVDEVHAHRWMANLRDDDSFVGWFSLRPDASRPRARELGYRLRRTVWGRGLATEGAQACVELAFAELGCDLVWAQTMTVNVGSRRVMEHCGLRYVRTFHADWDEPIEGTEEGDVVYELTRARWAELSRPGRAVGS